MERYEINKDTLALIPIDDDFTKVLETNKEIYLNTNTTRIIDYSCKFFGSSYIGRREASKEIIKSNTKLPIIVEESNEIIFFPTTSPRLLNQCIWLSLKNIKDFKQVNDICLVTFSNNKELILTVSKYIIENQILRATRLESLSRSRKNSI